MKITSDYKNEVLATLNSLPIGKENQIKIGDSNYDKFIEAIKIIIHYKQDIKNGYSITFNKDYSKLRKDYFALK